MRVKVIYLILVCLFTPMAAHAQSDFNVTWSVTGIGSVSSIDLDLNEGTQYLTANGGIHTGNGLILPITGTCFFTPQGGANCRLLAGNGQTVVLTVEPSISGTWRTLDVSGQIVETGTITLDEIR